MNELKKDMEGTKQGFSLGLRDLNKYRDPYDYGCPRPWYYPMDPFVQPYISPIKPKDIDLDELTKIYSDLLTKKDPEVTKLEKQLAEVQKKLADRKKRVEVENRIKELQAKIQAAQKELDSI